MLKIFHAYYKPPKSIVLSYTHSPLAAMRIRGAEKNTVKQHTTFTRTPNCFALHTQFCTHSKHKILDKVEAKRRALARYMYKVHSCSDEANQCTHRTFTRKLNRFSIHSHSPLIASTHSIHALTHSHTCSLHAYVSHITGT